MLKSRIINFGTNRFLDKNIENYLSAKVDY